MTISKLVLSSSKTQPPKKAVSFSKVKFTAARPVLAPGTADSSLQSTDTRRRYMRRGSKTAAMLQRAEQGINGYVSDPLESDIEYSDAFELAAAVASRQIEDANSCSASSTPSITKPRRQHHHRRSSSSSSFLFFTELEQAAGGKAPRRMSVMTALKANFESTSLSPAPFRRRMSLDMLM